VYTSSQQPKLRIWPLTIVVNESRRKANGFTSGLPGDKGRFIQRKNPTMDQQSRQMFPVDLQCAECGKQITELPFQPSGDRPVYCSDCLRARRGSRPMGGAMSRGPRQMFDVDATCAQCGTHISQLPFQPSGDRPIYCFECNKSRRASYSN
jgi:CxxC-x17-CxxC domain-containing protein